MKKRLLAFTVFITSIAVADELAPFTTDGCSLFPNGNPQHKSLWFQCCIQHDMAYWMGGTEQQRLDADLALEQCVNELGEPKIASIMLAGVRAGGTPYLPSSYRWGYGWSLQRGYLALNPEEKLQVENRLQALDSLIQNTLSNIKNTSTESTTSP